MGEQQSALDSWTSSNESEDDSGDTEEAQSDSKAADGVRKDANELASRLERIGAYVSEDAVMDDESCPWCLHPSDEFIVKRESDDDVEGRLICDPQVSCPNCSAVIPVDAEWYQEGEKIVV
jgi:hypothetical protein